MITSLLRDKLGAQVRQAQSAQLPLKEYVVCNAWDHLSVGVGDIRHKPEPSAVFRDYPIGQLRELGYKNLKELRAAVVEYFDSMELKRVE